MWSMVAQRLTQITPPAVTPDQLWQRVEAAWAAVPQEHIQGLFESMPRRVAASKSIQFSALRNYGTIERTQLPLIQRWACRVHKVERCTVDPAVVYLEPALFAKGQAFVSFKPCQIIGWIENSGALSMARKSQSRHHAIKMQ
ncbi:transposable element Tcb1 transposase [Trichonephila clavipes]|nr:transposable element Tcb1 transposase [Trichonephila clavipes]